MQSGIAMRKPLVHQCLYPGSEFRLGLVVVTVVAVLIAILSVPFAHADDNAPKANDQKSDDQATVDSTEAQKKKKRAKQLYELAKKLYAAEEFVPAAKAFDESYELDPRPGALFNQGRCYEDAGENKLAASAYRRYLEVEHDSDVTTEAKIRLLALERLIRKSEKNKKGDNGGKSSGSVVPQKRTRPGQPYQRIGAAIGAAGAIVVIAGGLVGIKSRSISSEFDGRPSNQWTPTEIERFNDGQAASNRAILLISAGGAALVTGAVLYLLGHRAERSAVVDIVPLVTSDSTQVSASFRF